ncbi:hypothetical protein EEB19_18960 [Gordonia sp. OPL2]|nr:hypothetical protein EEB19_18960 [Gordonia sp. OPL2]
MRTWKMVLHSLFGSLLTMSQAFSSPLTGATLNERLMECGVRKSGAARLDHGAAVVRTCGLS